MVNCLDASVDDDPRAALRITPFNMDAAEIGYRQRTAQQRVNGRGLVNRVCMATARQLNGFSDLPG